MTLVTPLNILEMLDNGGSLGYSVRPANLLYQMKDPIIRNARMKYEYMIVLSLLILNFKSFGQTVRTKTIPLPRYSI